MSKLKLQTKVKTKMTKTRNNLFGWSGWIFVEIGMINCLPESIQSASYKLGCWLYGNQIDDETRLIKETK